MPSQYICALPLKTLVVASAAILTVLTDGASALDRPAGDAARGRRVTEKWCVLCHAVAGARRPTAPAFAAIVRRAGRDDAYLRQFLDDDHFPMTTYRLFENEKQAVLAYFRSLRGKP